MQCSEAGTGTLGRGLGPADSSGCSPPSSAEAQPSHLICLHPTWLAAAPPLPLPATLPPLASNEGTPLPQSPWPLSTSRLTSHLQTWPQHPLNLFQAVPFTQTGSHTHPSRKLRRVVPIHTLRAPPTGVFALPPFESLFVPNAPSPGRLPTPQLAASLHSFEPTMLLSVALMGPVNIISPSFPPSPSPQWFALRRVKPALYLRVA